MLRSLYATSQEHAVRVADAHRIERNAPPRRFGLGSGRPTRCLRQGQNGPQPHSCGQIK